MAIRVSLNTVDTKQFVSEMCGTYYLEHGTSWCIVAIRPSGIAVDGPYTLGEAGKRRAALPFGTYLLRVPFNIDELPRIIARYGEEFKHQGFCIDLEIDDEEIVGDRFREEWTAKVVADLRNEDNWFGWRPVS